MLVSKHRDKVCEVIYIEALRDPRAFVRQYRFLVESTEFLYTHLQNV
jgi:hypothetical protein